jgi:thioredoxin-related protein
VKKLMERYQVTGMPTLVFIDTYGNENLSLRTTGYLGPKELLEKMDQVLPTQ